MWKIAILMAVCASINLAHDAHGRSTSPPEARHLKSPLPNTPEHAAAAKPFYDQLCASCHGADGKARTPIAGKLPVRPTNLAEYIMESMRDGEIYWVVSNGIEKNMPGFGTRLSDTQRWEMVQYVRELRARQRAVEKAEIGPYEWNLPPGFPLPNVPHDNPMTKEKVELGRYLFYDTRLSFNQTQSCATCHKPEKAFTDGRAHGKGSTGQLHPRGPMSLANVAYSPSLTWANPNVRTLEQQALVPMFGEDPVELGMTGKEDLLLARLKGVERYRKLFAAAFPGEDPFTIANVTKAIASFERIILSGNSPYDRYRLGDDPAAISDSAKRGETLFFSEQTECFHCHGGFNFTGTVDYLDKGFAEVEFHNTGLYNVKGKYSYPPPNLGLFLFTNDESDIGKFKAPTLRNIAITAPYMHDGSVKTLEDVIEHYDAGGRTISSGPNVGVGADNPNKSEFIKHIGFTELEKRDMLAFLQSLTDEEFLSDPALSNPWMPAAVTRRKAPAHRYTLRGEVVRVYADDGMIALYHDAIPGLMPEMRPPNTMEFMVSNPAQLKSLKPGQTVTALVRRQGQDYLLDDLRAVTTQAHRN